MSAAVRPPPAPGPTFALLAWSFVGYLLAVILFGAWVRITGSGAGCGAHWPLCDGQLVPRAPSDERLIEYTHRVTSGLCGVMALGLLAGAWRRFPSRSLPRRAALATLFFVLVEGAIGAALVKLELVAGNTSGLRAVVVGLHLGNTLLLTGSAALLAAGSGPAPRSWPGLARPGWLGVGTLVALAVTAMTGAVTALGDTLYPVGSEAAASAASHVLVKLRVLHPAIAVGAASLAGWLAWGRVAAVAAPASSGLARSLLILLGAQVLLGVVNIGLAAPGWAQLLHLLVAQLAWIVTVLLVAEGNVA